MATHNEIMDIHKSVMDINEGLFAFGFPFSLFADVDKDYYPHAAPWYDARLWVKRGIAAVCINSCKNPMLKHLYWLKLLR